MTVFATLLMLVVPAISGVAQTSQDCQSPMEGITVCEEDDDQTPEEISIDVANDTVGSLSVTYIDRTWWGWTEHHASVDLVPSDGGPAGEDEMHVEFTCWQDPNDPLVCNDASVQAIAGEPGSRDPPVRVDASCGWLSVEDQYYCGSLRVRGQAHHGELRASSSLTCGGGFGSQCPSNIYSGTKASMGDDVQRVGISARTIGGGVCVRGDLAHVGCWSISP